MTFLKSFHELYRWRIESFKEKINLINQLRDVYLKFSENIPDSIVGIRLLFQKYFQGKVPSKIDDLKEFNFKYYSNVNNELKKKKDKYISNIKTIFEDEILKNKQNEV